MPDLRFPGSNFPNCLQKAAGLFRRLPAMQRNLTVLLALGVCLPAAAQTFSGPASYSFGSQTVLTTTPASAAVTFTVTSATTFSSPQIFTQGSTNLDFTLGTGSTCVNTVQPGTCTVVVTFRPRQPGLRSGGLALTANGSTVNVLLSGNGVGPQVAYPYNPVSTNMGSPAFAMGMVFDAAGDLYLMDSSAGSLKKITNNNQSSINANAAVSTLVTGFNSPYGIAIDGLGDVFVADRSNNAVKEIVATSGTVTSSSVIRTLGSGFSNPYAVAVDTLGNVYVADNLNSAIKKIVAVKGSIPTTNPTIVTLVNNASRPLGIIVDASGNVFWTQAGDGVSTSATLNEIVASSGNNVVLATGANGTVHFPWSLVQDAAGDIYVADQSYITEFVAVNGSVQPNGPTYTLASGQNSAQGMAIDPLGNVFYTTGSVLYRLSTAVPPTLAFATTATGSVSTDSPKTVILENTGNAPLTFPVPASGATDPTVSSIAYMLGNNSTCPSLTQNSYSAATLPAGSSCTEFVSFQPTGGAGNYSGTLVFSDLNSQKASQTQTITLTATGTAGGGTTAQTITFSLPPSVLAGSTIPLSATASSGLPVYYGTTSSYAKVSGNSLIVYANATGTITVSAYQYGNGTYAAAPAVNRSTNVAPLANVGSTASLSAIVTITTAGTLGKVNVLSLGQASQDFVLSSSNCSVNSTYALNATCTANVTFQPKAAGIRLGAVQLTDNTGTKVLGTALISGTGSGPVAGYTAPNLPLTYISDLAQTAQSMVLDGAGNLFYLDQQDGFLFELTTSGGSVANSSTNTIAGIPYYANSLTNDGAGNLYVGSLGGILEFTTVGSQYPGAPHAASRTLASTYRVLAVAVDRFGDVFFAEGNGGLYELQAVNGVVPTNAAAISIGSNLVNTTTLAFDNQGNLYASDYYGTRYFAAVGGVVPANANAVGVNGLGPNYQSIVFDAAGNLYATDTNNNAVYQVRAVNGMMPASPVIVTLGGISNPRGMAIDNSGNLYVADNQAYLYRYVQNAPQAITFANADVGQNSPDSPVTVPLVNLGNAELTLSALAVTAPFGINSPTTSCAAATMVDPGSQCGVGLNFGPVAGGSATGTLTFTDNTLNVASSKQVAQLAGTGVVLSVTGVSPAAGSPAGGTVVTIYGTVLKGTTSVKFGGKTATNVTVIDDQTVMATAPSGTGGTAVDIVVTTANGSSAVSSADQYIYQLPTTLTLSIPDAHTGDPNFQVNAASNSAGNINYVIVSGPATISGNTISLNSGAAGRVVVEADQDANGYYAAASVQTAFTVENGTGSVWIVNGDGSVSEYDLNGNLLSSPSGQTGAAVGTVPSPQGAAFDSTGDLWIVGANGANFYTPNGMPGFSSPLTVAGISNAKSVIVDGTGHVWILNGNNSVSLISGTGSPISPATGYTGGGIMSPSALTIDTSGNLWITNGNNTLTEILGGAGPIAPLAIGVQNGTTGARP